MALSRVLRKGQNRFKTTVDTKRSVRTVACVVFKHQKGRDWMDFLRGFGGKEVSVGPISDSVSCWRDTVENSFWFLLMLHRFS